VNRRFASCCRSFSVLRAKFRLGTGPSRSNACLARASMASQARTVQLDLLETGGSSGALVLWSSSAGRMLNGMHVPLRKEPPSGPADLQTCRPAVLQRCSAESKSSVPRNCCDAPVPELDPAPGSSFPRSGAPALSSHGRRARASCLHVASAWPLAKGPAGCGEGCCAGLCRSSQSDLRTARSC
jgi:hypothetical protein